MQEIRRAKGEIQLLSAWKSRTWMGGWKQKLLIISKKNFLMKVTVFPPEGWLVWDQDNCKKYCWHIMKAIGYAGPGAEEIPRSLERKKLNLCRSITGLLNKERQYYVIGVGRRLQTLITRIIQGEPLWQHLLLFTCLIIICISKALEVNEWDSECVIWSTTFFTRLTNNPILQHVGNHPSTVPSPARRRKREVQLLPTCATCDGVMEGSFLYTFEK